MELIQQVRKVLKNDNYWEHRLCKVKNSHSSPFGIHLAIFIEPYLKFILDGKKTVESRFSLNRIAPYEKAHKGDIILLKRSGGPIIGLCEISNVWFYRLDTKSWKSIKKEFAIALCAQDPEFWAQRQHASYATLMKVKHATTISPIHWTKRDRRGWVILANSKIQNS